MKFSTFQPKVKVLSLTETPSGYYQLAFKKGWKTERVMFSKIELIDITNHPKAFSEIKKYLADAFLNGVIR